MKTKMLTLAAAVLLQASAIAETAKLEATSSDALMNFNHQKQVALALAPVKSKSDLEQLSMEHSPLDLLSDDAKQRFIDSIVFTDKGIGGYHYADLEAELTPTQIHSILSLIGVQHTLPKLTNARIETNADMLLMLTPQMSYSQYGGSAIGIGGGEDDHKDYHCASRATCHEEDGSICMSSC